MGASDQLMTNSGSWHSSWTVAMKKARTRKSRPCKQFHGKAGDGIRTHDLQLGNSFVGVQLPIRQGVTPRFVIKNEVC